MLLLIIFQHLPKFILCFSFKLLSWIWRFKYIWYVLSIAVILINTQIVHLWSMGSSLLPLIWLLLDSVALVLEVGETFCLVLHWQWNDSLYQCWSIWPSLGTVPWGTWNSGGAVAFFGLASFCTKWLVSDSKLDCYFHFGLLS